MNVRWTETSIDQLTAIHDYLARHSPDYALRVVDRITRCSVRIGTMPYSGRVVPEYQATDVREVYEKPYRVIYRLLTDQVDILSVIHATHQLPPSP